MLFLDTSAIIYYLHDVKPYSQVVEDIVSSENELYTSIQVIDEAVFTIVKTKAWLELGIQRIEKPNERIKTRGYAKSCSLGTDRGRRYSLEPLRVYT